MAYPSYPAGLPYDPLIDTWGIEAPFRAPVATEFEEGPERMRASADPGPAIIPYALLLTKEEFQTFKAFVYTDLECGASRFTILVPQPGGDTEEKVVWLDGGTYKAGVVGQYVRVSFNLKILDF